MRLFDRDYLRCVYSSFDLAGLLGNETLRILKIGKNPIQSAGAFGVLTALRQNNGTAMEMVNFADVVVSCFLHFQK